MSSRTPFGSFALLMTLTVTTESADALRFYAGGSLKATLDDVVAAYESAGGAAVVTRFGPSGPMRGRIEHGEPADVFASRT